MTRGNAVTVNRIKNSLCSLGCQVEVFSLASLPAALVQQQIRTSEPDIIHAFHAVYCGALAADISKELAIPYVITLTGTDMYRDNQDFTVTESEVLEKASALVVFSRDVGNKLATMVPNVTENINVIPQGVTAPFLEDDNDGKELFTFFLPAGIRKVKNVLFPLKQLEALWLKYPGVRLKIAGPVLDSRYGEVVMAEIDRAPFASWLGEVEHSEMSAHYQMSQVVLNCSYSEGGMANSLLEAMAHSRAVLASDIEGNRSLVTDGINGLLYSSEDEFLRKALSYIVNPDFRKTIARNGRAYVQKHCLPEKEAIAYLELYEKIIEP